MADVFFSYSSIDRERVAPAVAALKAMHITVFWDQTVAPGENWDAWIRAELDQAKVVLVFWSRTSIASRNVRDEANLALKQNKLIPALLDEIPDGDLPLGLGSTQCANLIAWNGEADDENWSKYSSEIEKRITPLYAQLRIDQAERRAENINERALRAATIADERVTGLQAELRDAVQGLTSARLDADQSKARVEALQKQLAHERAKLDGLQSQLLEVVRAKDAEIENILGLSDPAAQELVQKLNTEIETLRRANDVIRHRLFEDLEVREKQEAHLESIAALNEQLSAVKSASHHELQAARDRIELLEREAQQAAANLDALNRNSAGRRRLTTPRLSLLSVAIAVLSASALIVTLYGFENASSLN